MILRLRNDLYCVEWGVKLYSLTHPNWYDLMIKNRVLHQYLTEISLVCIIMLMANHRRCKRLGIILETQQKLQYSVGIRNASTWKTNKVWLCTSNMLLSSTTTESQKMLSADFQQIHVFTMSLKLVTIQKLLENTRHI